MAIVMSRALDQAIRGHGEETFPNECCGFMLGSVNGEDRAGVELMRADNDREEAAQVQRVLITPGD